MGEIMQFSTRLTVLASFIVFSQPALACFKNGDLVEGDLRKIVSRDGQGQRLINYHIDIRNPSCVKFRYKPYGKLHDVRRIQLIPTTDNRSFADLIGARIAVTGDFFRSTAPWHTGDVVLRNVQLVTFNHYTSPPGYSGKYGNKRHSGYKPYGYHPERVYESDLTDSLDRSYDAYDTYKPGKSAKPYRSYKDYGDNELSYDYEEYDSQRSYANKYDRNYDGVYRKPSRQDYGYGGKRKHAYKDNSYGTYGPSYGEADKWADIESYGSSHRKHKKYYSSKHKKIHRFIHDIYLNAHRISPYDLKKYYWRKLTYLGYKKVPVDRVIYDKAQSFPASYHGKLHLVGHSLKIKKHRKLSYAYDVYFDYVTDTYSRRKPVTARVHLTLDLRYNKVRICRENITYKNRDGYAYAPASKKANLYKRRTYRGY